MKNRNQWIDRVKAIGIIFVILGHHRHFLYDYIYTFHMPLFFFISGFLFNKDKYEKAFTYIKQKARTLLVPYFVFSTVLFILWIFIAKFLDPSILQEYSIKKNFIGIFYSQGQLEYMKWGVELWFLTCLFLTSILYYFLAKLSKLYLSFSLIGLAIIGFVLLKYSPIRLPWSLDAAFIAIMFFGIGNIFKKHLQSFKTSKTNFALLFIFLALNIIFFLLNDPGHIDLYQGFYLNIPYFYISAFSGILFYFLLCKYIPDNKIMNFLGVNSLIIYAFHMRALTVVNLIVYKILKLQLAENSFIVACVFTFLQIIILIPVIFIINRYFPFFIGKRKLRTK